MAGTVKEDSPSLRWTHCCRLFNIRCDVQHNLLRSQGSVSTQQLLQFNNNTSCHVRQVGFHLGSHLRRPEFVLQGILLLLCRALECCDDDYEEYIGRCWNTSSVHYICKWNTASISNSCTHIRIHSVTAQFLFSQLEEILSCSLDPIRFCLEAVSREFVKVAPMLGLEW